MNTRYYISITVLAIFAMLIMMASVATNDILAKRKNADLRLHSS